MNRYAFSAVLAAIALTAICFQNCSKVAFVSEASEKSANNTDLGGPSAPQLDPNDDLVCDPMNNSQSCDGGVTGEIYYMTAAQAKSYPAGAAGPNGVANYYQDGTRYPATIVLPDIFVPTRSFSDGFPIDATGELVSTADGPLVEYFAFKLFSDIKLQASDEEGQYQFALLSDDGSNLLNRETRDVIINDDNTHSTRMGCAKATVTLKKSSTLPIEVQYYQGPRTRIALVLMWRKVSPGSDLSDPDCDNGALDGNVAFFGPNMDNFKDYEYGKLLSRGWSRVPAGNLKRVTNL